MSFLYEIETPSHVFPFDWDEDEELRKYLSTTCLAPEPPSSPSSALSDDSWTEDPPDSTTINTPRLILPPSLAHAELLFGLEDGDSPEYSALPQQSLCNPLPLSYLDGVPFSVVCPSSYVCRARALSTPSNPISLDDSDEDATQVTRPILDTQQADETSRVKPTQVYLKRHRATRVASPAESVSPSPTEASTSPPPTTPSVKLIKRKRKAPICQEKVSDDEESSCRSGITTSNGRFLCMWSHTFGGDCTESFPMPQEHDKHVITHIPNVDGTLVTLFKCKTCVQKWTERRQSSAAKGEQYSIRKTEFGMFPRKDSCWRHINGHAKESGAPANSFLSVDKAPWYWPEYVFLTGTYKKVPRQERPEEETRSSKRVLQDIVAEHPSVVNKPHDALDGINNGGSCDCLLDGRRRSKRRRTSYE